jgi:uncharacterized protein (TIGR02594 family)
MPRPTGAYAWLNAEPGPRMLLEALKLYGVVETPGAANNPTIIGWAKELGDTLGTGYARWAARWYDQDAIPWCGLFMALVAARANLDGRADRAPPREYLSALAWREFGVGVPKAQAMLGDIAVIARTGGGHVTQIVGEDMAAFHCVGGNQNDAVTIARYAKTSVVAVRRVPYLNTPPNVRKVLLRPTGGLSSKVV